MYVILKDNFANVDNEEDFIIHLIFQIFRECQDIVYICHTIFKKSNNWIFLSGGKMISIRKHVFSDQFEIQVHDKKIQIWRLILKCFSVAIRKLGPVK